MTGEEPGEVFQTLPPEALVMGRGGQLTGERNGICYFHLLHAPPGLLWTLGLFSTSSMACLYRKRQRMRKHADSGVGRQNQAYMSRRAHYSPPGFPCHQFDYDAHDSGKAKPYDYISNCNNR